MLKVWKYPIMAADHFSLPLPEGAQVLTVQTQGHDPMLWALVDPSAKLVERHFRLAGTGHEIIEAPESLKYVGTFQLPTLGLVFHLFESD
jgi:hypothetical protein